jgi:hypothetical protein
VIDPTPAWTPFLESLTGAVDADAAYSAPPTLSESGPKTRKPDPS